MTRGRFPGVLSWIRLSVSRGFASGRNVFLTTMVGACVLSAMATPVVIAMAAVAAQTGGPSSALNTITVDHDLDPDQPRLTTGMRQQLAAIPGVVSVTALTTATFYSGDGKNNWIAVAHVARPSMIPPGVDRELALSLTGDELIAPAVVEGVDISGYVGKEMPIEYTRGTGNSQGELARSTVKVVAVYDPEWTGYGPEAALASEEFVTRLIAERYRRDPAEILDREGVPGVTVQVDSVDAVPAVMRSLQSMGFTPTRDSDRIGALPGIVAVFPALIGLAGLALGILIVLQTATAARHATSRRTREFALLRMRGYRIKDVRRVIVLDISSGAAAGALLGAVAGMLLGRLLSDRVIPPEVTAAASADPTAQVVAIGAGIVAAIVVVAAVAAGIATSHVHRADPFLLATREN